MKPAKNIKQIENSIKYKVSSKRKLILCKTKITNSFKRIDSLYCDLNEILSLEKIIHRFRHCTLKKKL